MKEKRKGPLSRAAGLAEGMAATVRRMQREREPRVLVYDPAGYARLVQPEARGHTSIMEIAEEMVAGEEPSRPRRRMTLVDPGLAGRVLERALARGGDMAELYAESRRGFALSLDDGRVERPQSGRERGACVRVVQGESTYYGYVDGLAEDGPPAGRRLGVGGGARRRAPAGRAPCGRGRVPARGGDARPRRSRPGARPSSCVPVTSAHARPEPRWRRRASATRSRTGRWRSSARTAARRPTTARASG